MYSERSSTKDSFEVIKKIGEGKFSVYQVYSFAHKTNFALKLFPKTPFGVRQYQKEKLMLRLCHPNVINYSPHKYQNPDFHCLLMEFAQYGNFFDFLTDGFLDNELLVRTYFHQLIRGLEYLHSQGVAHLDLKLENLVVGLDFMLKIIDFDQAQPISDRKIKSGGTIGYRPPEIINEECEDPAAADIYSAGIVLFMFKTKEYPFLEKEDPTNQDIRYYSTFVNNNDAYWKTRGYIRKDRTFYSQDFIEIINGMLHYDPKKRWKIRDIKSSKWFNGPILTDENIKVHMRTKWQRAMKQKTLRSRTPSK